MIITTLIMNIVGRDEFNVSTVFL